MAHRSDSARWWRRHLFYPLQTLVAQAVFRLFATLSPPTASAIGGWIGGLVGPRLGASRKARHNLERAFPALAGAGRETILRGMWQNLGRVIAEYPHLERLVAPEPDGPLELIGLDQLAAIRNGPTSTLMFSGHLANWELLAVAARRQGLDLTLIYRAPNNPSFDGLLRRARGVPADRLVAKGPAGAMALLRAVREHRHIAMLIDQKMNDGIAVPFFGRPAMTAPALAQLALRYRLPVVPVRTERIAGCRCRITVLPPLELPDSGNRNVDVLTLTTRINNLIESWVRDRPEQWLWLHRRWPD